jgi:DNA end-binding protein Ku
LQKLHYPHELRSMESVPELDGAQKLDKNELKLATTLVEQMATSLGEIDTVDNYHEALKKLIDSKIKGKKTVEFEVEELPRLDIMSALKKSLQQSSRKPMVKAESTTKKKPQITLVKPMAKRKAS